MPTRNALPPLPVLETISQSHLATAILAAMGDSISIIGRDFRVLYQNPVHQKLIGKNHVGALCYQAYSHRDAVCPGCPVETVFRDGGSHRLTKETIPGIEASHIEIMASPLYDDNGEIVAGIEIVRDISELTKARESAEALNRDLLRQACELEAANRELETFSYSLSHDMRTPLAQIQLAADSLREVLPKGVGADTTFLLDTLENSTTRLNRLIEAMLELAHASTFTLKREVFDLSAAARDIMLSLRLQAPSRKIELQISDGLETCGDPVLLRTAAQNLLENAWKYTAKNRGAQIQVGACETSGERVFFIRDNGIGFSGSDQAKLFQPFSRLTNASEFRGTGLGLATTQRIIQRHGGRIWAESQPGEGATFYFTLPD